MIFGFHFFFCQRWGVCTIIGEVYEGDLTPTRVVSSLVRAKFAKREGSISRWVFSSCLKLWCHCCFFSHV